MARVVLQRVELLRGAVRIGQTDEFERWLEGSPIEGSRRPPITRELVGGIGVAVCSQAEWMRWLDAVLPPKAAIAGGDCEEACAEHGGVRLCWGTGGICNDGTPIAF